MDLPQAENQHFRDGNQKNLAEESSGHTNSKANRLEFGVVIESEPHIITTTIQPLAFSFQCHVCGWEYVVNGRCERCGN